MGGLVLRIKSIGFWGEVWEFSIKLINQEMVKLSCVQPLAQFTVFVKWQELLRWFDSSGRRTGSLERKVGRLSASNHFWASEFLSQKCMVWSVSCIRLWNSVTQSCGEKSQEISTVRLFLGQRPDCLMDLGELINFSFCLLLERVDLYLGIPKRTLE